MYSKKTGVIQAADTQSGLFIVTRIFAYCGGAVKRRIFCGLTQEARKRIIRTPLRTPCAPQELQVRGTGAVRRKDTDNRSYSDL